MHARASLLAAIALFACACTPRTGATRTDPKPATGATPTASPRTCGQVERVLGVAGSGWERKTTLLIALDGVKAPAGPVLFTHDAAVRAIEDAQQILFDDYAGRAPDRAVRVCFGGASTHDTDDAGQGPLALDARTIYPDPDSGDSEVDIASLRPPCPAPDARHRYVEVPVSYADPGLGTFQLYYELSSDFAPDRPPDRPIVLTPADGQVTYSMVGQADVFKQFFGTGLDVVTFQYRGTFCSRIPQLAAGPGIDWAMAAAAFRGENVVEDMERIRQALVGRDGKIMVAGGSGTAITALAYVAKYHAHVERALLLSLFKDAEGGSRAGVAYFDDFLARHGLRDAYARIVADARVPLLQFLYVIQRLLYVDDQAAIELVQQVSRGDVSAIDAASSRRFFGEKIGSVDYFVRSYQASWPHAVVFMYETNVPTSPAGQPDINLPFLQIGAPIERLVAQGRLTLPRLDIRGLGAVATDVLLVGGTLDQVTPLAEMEKIRAELPAARLAVFDTYHVMMKHDACRHAISDAFLRHGSGSPALAQALRGEACGEIFLALK